MTDSLDARMGLARLSSEPWAKMFCEEVRDLIDRRDALVLQVDGLQKRLNLILCGKEKPDGEWTPELRAAHAARIEFMEALGGSHYSRTDAAFHVRKYTERILEESNRLNERLQLALGACLDACPTCSNAGQCDVHDKVMHGLLTASEKPKEGPQTIEDLLGECRECNRLVRDCGNHGPDPRADLKRKCDCQPNCFSKDGGKTCSVCGLPL